MIIAKNWTPRNDNLSKSTDWMYIADYLKQYNNIYVDGIFIMFIWEEYFTLAKQKKTKCVKGAEFVSKINGLKYQYQTLLEKNPKLKEFSKFENFISEVNKLFVKVGKLDKNFNIVSMSNYNDNFLIKSDQKLQTEKMTSKMTLNDIKMTSQMTKNDMSYDIQIYRKKRRLIMQNISNYKKKYGEQDPKTTAQVKRLQDLETQMTSQKVNNMSYDKMTSNDIQMTSNDTKMTSPHNIYREKEIEKEKCVLSRAKENDKNDTHTQNDIKFQKMTIEKLILLDKFKNKLLGEGANNTIPRCFDNNNFDKNLENIETILLYVSPIKTCCEKVKRQVEVLLEALDKNTNAPFKQSGNEKQQNFEIIKNIVYENQYCSVETLLKFVLKFYGKKKENGFFKDMPMYSEFEEFIDNNKDITINNNRIFRKIKELLEDKKNKFNEQDTKPKVDIECYKVVKSDIECSGENVVCKCCV